MKAMLALSPPDSPPPSRLPLRSTLGPTSFGGFSGGVSLDEPLLPASSLTRNTRNTRTRRALQILMMTTTGTCRRATTRRTPVSESPHDAPPSRQPPPTRLTAGDAYYATRTGRAAQQFSVDDGGCTPSASQTGPVRTHPGACA